MTIQSLKIFFESVKIPKKAIELSKCETIHDCEKFVKSHLSMLENNKGNKTFMPYYDRLVKLKKKL